MEVKDSGMNLEGKKNTFKGFQCNL